MHEAHELLEWRGPMVRAQVAVTVVSWQSAGAFECLRSQ
jgi:hypothetical protein